MEQAELHFEALGPPEVLAQDLYLSVRIGDVQRFTSVSGSGLKRPFKFPKQFLGDLRCGRVDIYQRVAGCSFSTSSLGAGSEELRLPRLDCAEELSFGVSLAQPRSAAEEALAEEEWAQAKSAYHLRHAEEARLYLKHHNLEFRLADAMQALLKARPEDPEEFLHRHLCGQPKEARPRFTAEAASQTSALFAAEACTDLAPSPRGSERPQDPEKPPNLPRASPEYVQGATPGEASPVTTHSASASPQLSRPMSTTIDGVRATPTPSSSSRMSRATPTTIDGVRAMLAAGLADGRLASAILAANDGSSAVLRLSEEARVAHAATVAAAGKELEQARAGRDTELERTRRQLAGTLSDGRFEAALVEAASQHSSRPGTGDKANLRA